ncbi:MAG: ribonuclease P protein component [Candidatus Cloacimonetes bacterium]|nr:ribonuclease P protein component [Candidatus Cloacimonadota bacterium]
MYATLKRRSDFKAVYEKHKRFSGRHFILLVNPKIEEIPTIGIVASRKVGNAVCRNLIKRRVRAFLRENSPDISLNNRAILIARSSTSGVGWLEFSDDLKAVFASVN